MVVRSYREFISYETIIYNLKETSSLNRYTPEQLYNVISDVDSYHLFVPYCTASKVLNTTTLESSLPGSTNPTGQVGPSIKKEAALTVGFLAFRERYISEVTCIPYLSVEVRLHLALLTIFR